MKRVFQCIITPFLLAVFLALAGCRKEERSDFDRLETQILSEALTAIRNEDHKLALAKLERLARLKPTSEFIQRLILRERENLALKQIKVPLDQADVEEAWKRLRQAEIDVGRTPGLRRIRKQLEGLQTIADFRARLPFGDADTAAEQVARLPRTELFPGDRRYAAWRAEQQQMAKRLFEEQRVQVGAELLEELDLALVADSPRVRAIRAQLQALNPQAAAVRRRFASPAKLGDLDGLSFDLICFQQAAGPDAATRTAILQLYRQRRPHSLCGEYLRSWAELAAGQSVAGLNRLARLRRLVPALRNDLLTPSIVALVRRRSAAISPSVQGVLEQLYHLQNAGD